MGHGPLCIYLVSAALPSSSEKLLLCTRITSFYLYAYRVSCIIAHSSNVSRIRKWCHVYGVAVSRFNSKCIQDSRMNYLCACALCSCLFEYTRRRHNVNVCRVYEFFN